MLNVVLGAPSNVVAYTMAVRFVDNGNGAAMVDHVKIFRNHIGAHFIFRLHENVMPSLSPQGDVIKTNLFIMHANQDTTEGTTARKKEMHYRLLQMDLAEQGEHAFILFNLGMTDYFNGDYERSLEWFERSIAAGEPEQTQTRKTYALWSAVYRKLQRFDEALTVAMKGLVAVGEDPELRSQAGCSLIDLGRYEEATSHFMAVKPDSLSGHFSSIDPIIFGAHRDHHLALASLGLQDYPRAKSWLFRALEYKPLYLPSLHQLRQSALEQGDFATLRKAINVVEITIGRGQLWNELANEYNSLTRDS